MSVMRCSRPDCENIMCDRYSSKYGYICGECFTELINLGVNVDIGEFMNTSPGIRYEERQKAIEKYSKIFSDE